MQTRRAVTVEPDAPGLVDLLVYAGTVLGGVLLTVAGYKARQKPETQMATVAGAIVDNSVLQPLLQALNALTDRLDVLIAALTRDVELREAEAEEEQQQERAERAVEKIIERLMRDNPAAIMPATRPVR